MSQPKRYRLDVYSEDGATRQGTILTRDLTEAKITEETNGPYMLGFSTPIDAAPGENGLIISRWQVWAYDLDAEAAGGYTPRKFRMQRINRVQDSAGRMVFKVEAEHIRFDMLSEVIPAVRVVANLTADEILDELLLDSAFSKDTTDDFLQKFTIDEFVIGGVLLDNLMALVQKVGGDLQVTDGLKVNILEKKVVGTDAVSARATTRYNLLQLQREDDSRRLVTRMFAFGGGEPRMTLAGTWHPCAQAYQSRSGVAIHKLAPSNDAFEPRDSGTANVKRYFIEFRAMIGTYWPIKRFEARTAVFGGGADFVEVEIQDLSDAVGWNTIYALLNGAGDFCRLWVDETSSFVGGWTAESAGPPLMDVNAAAPPIDQDPLFDCHRLPITISTFADYDRWVEGIFRSPNEVYIFGNSGNFHFWDNDHKVDVWATERNENPVPQRSGRPAYHPDYGVMIIGYDTSNGIRSRKIPLVDHYTVDGGSDETDVLTITDLTSLAGGHNFYMTDIVRRGDEFIVVGAQTHASAAYATIGGLRQAVHNLTSWTSAVHVLNTPEATGYLKESTAAHPGGAGLDPTIHDVFLRCDNPLGGGLHYFLRFTYDNTGSNESGHMYYQYGDNEGEYLTELDNFYASDDTTSDYGYGIPAVKMNEPGVVGIAVWEHIDGGTDNHTLNLKILRRTGPVGLPGTWLWETVDSWTGLTDAVIAAFKNTNSNGKGNTTTRICVDFAWDDLGNEWILYTRYVGGNSNVYYRFKDNSVGTPVWGSEVKVSTGSDWVEADYDPYDVTIFKENGYVRAKSDSHLRFGWSAVDSPSVFNIYPFIGGAQFGEDPSPGDGLTTFDADVILVPEAGYPTDCAGNTTQLTPVDWIEERDTSVVPAARGYERHGFIDGLTDQSDLEFTENLFDDAFLSRLAQYASGLHTFINDIGNGSPTFTKNADRTYVKNGALSQKVVTTAQNEGCYIDFDMDLASNCADYFAVRVLIYLEEGGEVQLDVSEGDKDTWANRGTQTIFPPSTGENLVKVTRPGFVEIQFSGIEKRGGSDGRLWFYQPGATGATYYIDSIQIEPLASPSAEWIETSTRRLLWSRAYDELVKVNGVRKIYRVNMRDLEIEGLNPYDAFSPRDIVEIENEELGVPKTKLLTVRKTEDLLDPGNVEIDVADRLENAADHTASLYTRVIDGGESTVRSIRKTVRERLRLGPPKVGMIVRPDEPSNMDLRTTILDGSDDPYP